MGIAGLKGDFLYSNGKAVAGWVVDDVAPCGNCGSKLIYSEDYDSLFCKSCNYWVEDACCNDPSCESCHGRPEHPLAESIR